MLIDFFVARLRHWASVFVCFWILLAPTFAEDGAAITRPAPAAEFSNFADALMLSVTQAGDRLVAVGEHGLITLSDDQGQSWRQSRTGVPDTTLSAVTFIDDSHGWAVGRDEAVLYSADGGDSWQLQHWNPYPDSGLEAALLEVLFVNAADGFAVGANGVLMRTDDGGANWQRDALMHSEGYEPHLFDISGGGDQPLYISAEEGTLLRSVDGGDSWQELAVPFAGSLFGAIPVGTDGVLAYAMLGKAFYSPDRGDSWQPLETGTRNAWMNGRDRGDGSAVLVGYRGTVGVLDVSTLAVTLQPQQHRRAIADLLVMSAGQLLLAGQGGAWLSDFDPAISTSSAVNNQGSTALVEAVSAQVSQ
ncbi:MAG: hypothetical protein JKY89_09425 [Immundisolibacteraceae bacterium]|nr:hypothetical protein [Immundisolibacteraceae bacterium]